MGFVTRIIDKDKADLAITYLRDHIEYLADLENVPASKRKRYLVGEFDGAVFSINVFIEHLQKYEVTYPQSSQIAMYLEFRKRCLHLCEHTQEVRDSIHQLDDLFDYFNSNSGI